MKKNLLFISLLFITKLFSNSEIGCSIDEVLKTPRSTVFENFNDSNCTDEIKKNNITEKLISINVLHENEEVLIERKVLQDERLCPPFCIEPMNIKEVVTVGELEVLDFISKLKEKKSRLLIDVRKSILYEESTIPGAVNLPFFMLKDDSSYQKEVLKLLGAKVSTKSSKEQWTFKHAHFLLVFGGSATSNEASSAVTQLLNLGYPSSKLLYYRAGIASWKVLGLTTY